MPMPPSCAMVMASRDSVTVSIAADTSGRFRAMLRERRVERLVSRGNTWEYAGTNKTSSKVSALPRRRIRKLQAQKRIIRTEGQAPGTARQLVIIGTVHRISGPKPRIYLPRGAATLARYENHHPAHERGAAADGPRGPGPRAVEVARQRRPRAIQRPPAAARGGREGHPLQAQRRRLTPHHGRRRA